MKRTIAYLVEPKRFELFDEELRPIADDEMLIQTISSGLCHSDVNVYMGKANIVYNKYGNMCMGDMEYPVAFGHEPIGVVVETGKDIKKFKKGDYVSGTTLLQGAFATYIIVKEIQMAGIPEGTRNIEKCLVEPMQCCVNIVRAANPQFYDTCAVIGCGIMGLMTIGGLKNSGAKEIIAIDFDDGRLEHAKKLGATLLINPGKQDLDEIIYEVTENRGVDVVIEITGSLGGLKTASKIVRNAEFFGALSGGKILIPSMYGKTEMWDAETGYNLMIKSAQLHSVHPWYSSDLERDREIAVQAYIDKVMPIDEYVTHEFKLEDINEAFEVMTGKDPAYIKGAIRF